MDSSLLINKLLRHLIRPGLKGGKKYFGGGRCPWVKRPINQGAATSKNLLSPLQSGPSVMSALTRTTLSQMKGTQPVPLDRKGMKCSLLPGGHCDTWNCQPQRERTSICAR